MNLQEFEQGYAERLGVTVERLHALGVTGASCECGDDACQGWQMLWPEKIDLRDVRAQEIGRN